MRRTAWDNNAFEHEYDRLFDYQKHNRITGLHNTEPHYDGLQHTMQPFQNTQVVLQLPNEEAYRYKKPSRNDVRVREQRSPEEQELDRTVQWAMDNFQCSEAGQCNKVQIETNFQDHPLPIFFLELQMFFRCSYELK